MFENIYEIEADSKENALEIANNDGLDDEHYMGETDVEELNGTHTFKRKIEEWPAWMGR